jgi:hypothetical protein
MTIPGRRLVNQRIAGAGHRRAADVVSWCGAMQAQEYEPAKWGVGLRMGDGAVDADVERAVEHGEILRTHVMRPTWHFVTPEDICWLLELTAPRVHRMMATYNRRLELDAAMFGRATRVLERALRDRQNRTRLELREHLRRAGITAAGQRLAHLVMHAELEGIICSGPRRGKQSTYALVAERAPTAPRLPRDEALAELTRRFFTSHGPATVRDFAWWSGLTMADGRRGLEMNRARREDVDGLVYWSIEGSRRTHAPRPGRKQSSLRERCAHFLPIYDEYLVAYRDRVAVPHSPPAIAARSGVPAMFQHAVIVDGQIVGTWRTPRGANEATIDVVMLRRVTARERRAMREAAERYGRFRGIDVKLSISEC